MFFVSILLWDAMVRMGSALDWSRQLRVCEGFMHSSFIPAASITYLLRMNLSLSAFGLLVSQNEMLFMLCPRTRSTSSFFLSTLSVPWIGTFVLATVILKEFSSFLNAACSSRSSFSYASEAMLASIMSVRGLRLLFRISRVSLKKSFGLKLVVFLISFFSATAMAKEERWTML